MNPSATDGAEDMEIDLDIVTKQQQEDEQQAVDQVQNNELEKQRVLVNYLKVLSIKLEALPLVIVNRLK